MKKISEWPKWGRITFYVFVAFLVLMCPFLIIPLVAWWVIRRYLRWSAENRLTESAARLEKGESSNGDTVQDGVGKMPKGKKREAGANEIPAFSKKGLCVLGALALVVFFKVVGSCDKSDSDDDDSMTEVPSQYEGQSFMGFKFGEAKESLSASDFNEMQKAYVVEVPAPVRLLDVDSFGTVKLFYTAQTKRLYKIKIQDEVRCPNFPPHEHEEAKVKEYAETIKAIMKEKYGVEPREYENDENRNEKGEQYDVGQMKIVFCHCWVVPSVCLALGQTDRWNRRLYLVVEDKAMQKVAKTELKLWKAEKEKMKEKAEREEREARVKSAKDLL